MAACRWLATTMCLLPLATAVKADDGQPVALLITDSSGAPAADLAVYLPDVQAPAPDKATVVDQRGQAFVPRVSVARAGSEVLFTNSDPTSHHVYSFSRPNAFALPLYKGDERLRVRFDKPGIVVLGCNIHDSMLGYIVVVDSTRAGVTDPAGRITLEDVPPGRHRVLAWAPGLDRERPPEIGVLEVGAQMPAEVRFRLAERLRRPAAGKSGSLAGGDY